MTEKRIPTHPGEILRDELVERGLSANRLARDLGVDSGRIVEILHGRRAITADTAVRLAQYFGTSAEVWLNMQLKHDLAAFEHEKGEAVRRQVRQSA